MSVKAVAVLTILLVATAVCASADITYVYTANPFDQFWGGDACPSTCQVTGWITFAQPLPAGLLTLTFFNPEHFSFTDGNVTINDGNASIASSIGFTTDWGGNITGWNIQLFNEAVTTLIFSSTNPPGCNGCDVYDYSYNWDTMAGAIILDNPGTWTIAGTPEPASVLLVVSGLLAAGMRRVSRNRAA